MFLSTVKEETKDQVELQLTLKVCQEDLTKTQEELNRMKAEYWDVVPRHNWDILEQTHKQTLLQVTYLDTTHIHLHVHIVQNNSKCQHHFTILFVFFVFAIQLTTLQGDFDQMKCEYDTMLELHKKNNVHDKIHNSTIVQVQYNTQ